MQRRVNFGVKNHVAILKMDARDGCLKMRDLSGNEVTFKAARIAMDLAKIEVGWAQFRKGEGVVIRGTADDPPPGEDWQLAVRVAVEGIEDVAELGGPIGEAEICSTAYVVRGAFADLHDQQFLPQSEGHAGAIPIVDVSDWRAVSTRNGILFAPVMRIVGWRKKGEAVEPDDLEDLLS